MIRAIFALSVLLAFTVPAIAEGCEMTTSQPEITTPACGVNDLVPCFYVDNDLCHAARFGPLDPVVERLDFGQRECISSFWVYQESNGIPGLQRGDEVVDDTCGGTAGPSDTIVF